MELVNELARTRQRPTRASPPRPPSSLIQPYAPHVAEELWERLGHERLWEQPWPRGGPGAARARHVRARRPGERQGARPLRGRRRRCRRTSWSSARCASRAGARAPERQAGPEDDRRPGQARELRRRLSEFRCRCGRSARLSRPATTRTCAARGRADRLSCRRERCRAGLEPDAIAAFRVRDGARRAPGRVKTRSMCLAGASHGVPTLHTGASARASRVREACRGAAPGVGAASRPFLHES